METSRRPDHVSRAGGFDEAPTARPYSSSDDEFFDWLIAQEQAGASIEEIHAKINADYERRFAEIRTTFAALEEAEREADQDPFDEELERKRQVAMHEAMVVADRPPTRLSAVQPSKSVRIRTRLRVRAPRRLDRRLACPRPRARAVVRASSRGGDGGDPDLPDGAGPPPRRRRREHLGGPEVLATPAANPVRGWWP